VFLISVHPFITNNHGENYYTVLGGICSFASMIFSRWQVKDGIKLSQRYHIICIVVMLLGVASLFILFGKKTKDVYSDFELCSTTYFGAMMGMILATLITDVIDKEKKEKELKKRLQNINVPNIKLNWIDVTEKLPTEHKEVLCRNSIGAYFVGYIKTENIDNKIIHQCNSGDEGMSNVVCWIELSEIEKTIPEILINKIKTKV
jgi:hypothetical protein